MIYLIRHTQPAVAKGFCYGQTDLDVADSFEYEAIQILEKMNCDGEVKVISSPLNRCLKLAEYLFPGQEINLEAEIMELDFGKWEMNRWDDLDPEILKAWGNNFLSTPPPGGENFNQLFYRVCRFWKELDVENRNYAIVAHDGVIRCILSHLLEMPLKKAFSFEIPYGTVIQLNFFDAKNCKIRFL